MSHSTALKRMNGADGGAGAGAGVVAVAKRASAERSTKKQDYKVCIVAF